MTVLVLAVGAAATAGPTEPDSADARTPEVGDSETTITGAGGADVSPTTGPEAAPDPQPFAFCEPTTPGSAVLVFEDRSTTPIGTVVEVDGTSKRVDGEQPHAAGSFIVTTDGGSIITVTDIGVDSPHAVHEAGGRVIDPAITADGAFVFFTLDDAGSRSLHLWHTATGEVEDTAASLVSVHQSTISPDGDRLAWVEEHSGTSRVRVTNRDGATLWTSDSSIDTNSPAFSPDGTRLAASESIGATRRITVWELALANEPGTPITGGGLGSHTDPAWHPDCTSIAYVQAADGSIDIWAVSDQRPEPLLAIDGAQVRPSYGFVSR